MKYEILENVIDSLESIGAGADIKIKQSLNLLYDLRDEILSERMYERSLNAEDIVSKYSYGKGGRMRFKDKVQAISERLEGTKVPAKYRRQYGSTYDKQESEMAGRRIAGAMMKKYGE